MQSIISYNQPSLKDCVTTSEEYFWKRVSILREFLEDNIYSTDQLEFLGYTQTEIKTAITLNERRSILVV